MNNNNNNNNNMNNNNMNNQVNRRKSFDCKWSLSKRVCRTLEHQHREIFSYFEDCQWSLSRKNLIRSRVRRF